MDFCSLASGSSGNCIYIGTEQTSVLVDAGISRKKIEDGLHSIDRRMEDVDAILVTHEHADHISGLGVTARKYGLPVYATSGTIREMLSKNMLGSVDASLFHPISPDEPFSLGDLSVLPFRTSHDAADPVAYRFTCGSKSAAIATDMGYYDEYIVDHLRDLDAVLVEANHDINMLQAGSYPYYLKQRILGLKGHLSNDSAGRLLCEILNDRIETIFLGHLSRENNYEALALATVASEITMGENPYRAEDFRIEIAKRDVPSRLVTV